MAKDASVSVQEEREEEKVGYATTRGESGVVNAAVEIETLEIEKVQVELEPKSDKKGK